MTLVEEQRARYRTVLTDLGLQVTSAGEELRVITNGSLTCRVKPTAASGQPGLIKIVGRAVVCSGPVPSALRSVTDVGVHGVRVGFFDDHDVGMVTLTVQRQEGTGLPSAALLREVLPGYLRSLEVAACKLPTALDTALVHAESWLEAEVIAAYRRCLTRSQLARVVTAIEENQVAVAVAELVGAEIIATGQPGAR